MKLRRVLLILFVASARWSAGADLDLTRWTDAAQDSTGVVWAVRSDGPHLFSHDGSTWKEAVWQNEAVSGMETLAMTRSPSGAVLILWSDELDPRSLRKWLTEHRGKESRVIAKFEGAIDHHPSLFADTKGRTWITHRGRGIYRVEPDGRAEVIHQIADEELIEKKPKAKSKKGDELNAINAIEASNGEIWFWSEKKTSSRGSLKNFLVYDGAKFGLHTFVDVPPDALCFTAVQTDGEHVLAAFKSIGIFRLDLRNLTASRIEGPEGNVFGHQIIYQIIATDTACYVIVSGKDLRRDLWRVPDGGSATKAATPIDHVDGKLPTIRAGGGLVMGSGDHGIFFLADGAGDFQKLDWRSNFPLLRMNRLFALPNEKLLGIQFHEGSATLPAPPWPKPQENSNIQVAGTAAPAKDDRGHLWLADTRLENVREWDGRDWREHQLPPHRQLIAPLLADNRGRIWANTRDAVFIWEPTKNEWRQEINLHHALERELAADPKFVLRSNSTWQLSFSGDGRVALRDCTGVRFDYFDGHEWREWKSGAIRYAQPHFNNGAELVAFDRNLLWKLNGNDFSAEPSPAATPAWAQENPTSSQTAQTLQPYDSIARDETGAFWITQEHRLYRQRGQVRRPVFAKNEVNPFVDGRRAEKAVSDSNGNVFLSTNATGECVLIRRKLSPPKTQVKIEVRQDSLHAKMQTDRTGEHWFEWKLDEGAWSEPIKNADVVLDSLGNGDHVFAARAIDHRLDLDEHGASIPFKIAVDLEKQRAEAILHLSSRDFSERERAVRALAKQGRNSVPALQRARDKAAENERWWIDATIQEIERQEKDEKRAAKEAGGMGLP